jgi:hypothetical protein
MRVLPILSVMLLVAGAAVAQPGPDQAPPDAGQMAPQGGQMAGPNAHAGFRAKFAAANTTNDGHLTLEQAQAAHMGAIVKNFAQIDAGQKGYVTLQDVKAWHDARMQARAAGQPPQ